MRLWSLKHIFLQEYKKKDYFVQPQKTGSWVTFVVSLLFNFPLVFWGRDKTFTRATLSNFYFYLWFLYLWWDFILFLVILLVIFTLFIFIRIFIVVIVIILEEKVVLSQTFSSSAPFYVSFTSISSSSILGTWQCKKNKQTKNN